jgi:Leucine-rich repeat (LRR) protein
MNIPKSEANSVGPVPVQKTSRQMRWRYSLRTLMAIITVAGISCGLISSKFERARRQHGLIERLESAGAEVYYDYMVEKIGSWMATNRVPSPEAPVWQRWLGDDFFHAVAAVRVDSRESCDDDVTILKGLPNLRVLSLHGRGLTDVGVSRLTSFTDLQLLELSDTALDDEGAELLASFPNLIGLNVSGTDITDEGLCTIGNLSRLETLMLRSTHVSDRGLSYITKMKSLRELHLDHTHITDAHLLMLKSLMQLEHLTLSDEAITDGKGLIDLAHELPKLKISLLLDSPSKVTELPTFRVANIRLLCWRSDHWMEAGGK